MDNPADPGGATNLGITRGTLAHARGRAVSKAEVMALSKAEAADIYQRAYWDAICGDNLPIGLDCVAFDCAVNSGPVRAINYLCAIVQKKSERGIQGEVIAALALQDPRDLIAKFSALRLSFLERLTTFRIFGRGWSQRVAAVQAAANAQISLHSPLQAAPPLGKVGQIPGQMQKGNPMNASVNADNTKPFWASQTVWSSIAVIGSSICGGLLSWRNHDIGGFGASLTAIFGGVNAIVGRFRATTKIQ